MDRKLLITVSFLTALLCHLAIFNLIVFVFPIDPETPKPKFFFLGPILTQKDISQTDSQKGNSQANATFNHFSTDATGPESQSKNPFAIQSIGKPPQPRAVEPQEKIVLKSMFELPSRNMTSKPEQDSQKPDEEIILKPYKPLQFGTPATGADDHFRLPWLEYTSIQRSRFFCAHQYFLSLVYGYSIITIETVSLMKLDTYNNAHIARTSFFIITRRLKKFHSLIQTTTIPD